MQNKSINAGNTILSDRVRINAGTNKPSIRMMTRCIDISDEGPGVGAWVRRWWRALLAELVSTALLVWLGCATLVPVAGPTSVQLTHPAFAFGFLVVGNICAFGAASGAHMNPAVTLGALIYGQLEWLPALTYVVAQLVGAAIGFAGLVATSPADVLSKKTGVTLPGSGVSSLAAVATEAVITGVLVLTVCGVWAAHDPLRPDYSAPLKIGVVVAGLVYAGVSLTTDKNHKKLFVIYFLVFV